MEEEKVSSLFETKESTLEFLKWEAENCFDFYRTKDGYRKAPTTQYPPVGIPEEYFDDREFAIAAVKLNGSILCLLPDKYKYDKEIILLAAPTCSLLFLSTDERFDPKIFTDDREFFLQVLAVNGLFLKFAKTDDLELICTAIAQNYQAGLYIGYSLLRDRETVKRLVATNGRVLEYCGADMRDDEEIVYIAVASYRAFEFASNRLKTDETFLMKVLDKNPSCIAYAPIEYRKDIALMRELIGRHPYVYRYVKGDAAKDVELAIYALGLDAQVWQFVQRELYKTRGFVPRVRKLIDGGTLDAAAVETLRDAVKEWRRRNDYY